MRHTTCFPSNSCLDSTQQIIAPSAARFGSRDPTCRSDASSDRQEQTSDSQTNRRHVGKGKVRGAASLVCGCESIAGKRTPTLTQRPAGQGVRTGISSILSITCTVTPSPELMEGSRSKRVISEGEKRGTHVIAVMTAGSLFAARVRLGVGCEDGKRQASGHGM